nr:hypothetical protein [Streptomyces sp. NRRL S-495]
MQLVAGASADHPRGGERLPLRAQLQPGILVLVRRGGQLGRVVHVLELGHRELVVRGGELDQAAVRRRSHGETPPVARPLRTHPVDPDIERDRPLLHVQGAERVQHELVGRRQFAQRHPAVAAAGRQNGTPALDLGDLAREQRQHRDRRQRGVVLLSPADVEVGGDLQEEQRDRAAPARPPRRRTLQPEPQVDAEQPHPERLERDVGGDLDDEGERGEAEQRVEGEMALDPEVLEAQPEFRGRPELYGVAGEGEVPGHPDQRPGPVQDVDGQPVRHRERQRRGPERRVEPADRQHQVRVVPPGDEQAHTAVDRHGEDPRLEELREEPQPRLVELDRADERDLQDQQRELLGGQRALQHPEDRQVARDLDHDAQRDADQRRRAPADLGHRPDQELPLLGREEGPQIAEDPRGVGDDVLGEHHRLDPAGAHPLDQRLKVHPAVEADQAADGEQGEAVPQLQAEAAELGGDHDQHREAVGAVRHPGADQADRLEIHEPGELQLQCAGVLAARRVGRQEAPAGDHPGVDRETDAGGRFELEADVQGTEVAALAEPRPDDHPDPVDRRLDRTQLGLEGGGDLQRHRAVRADPRAQVQRGDLDRAQLQVGRDRQVE